MKKFTHSSLIKLRYSSFIIFLCSMILLSWNQYVSAQNPGCFSFQNGDRSAYTDPGVCYYTVTPLINLDIASGSTSTCLFEKNKWTFTYVLDGATTGTGTGSLLNIHLNKGLTGVQWTGVYNATDYELSFQKVYVLVEDKEAPVVVCGPDITVNTDADTNGAIVNYPQVTATDNCMLDTLYLETGLPSGAFFPVGTTLVRYAAKDVDNNMGYGSFNVTVIDNQPPDINLNKFIHKSANTTNGRYVNYDVTANDNSKQPVTIELLSGKLSGELFNPDSTYCVYKATDIYGNFSLDTLLISIYDTIAPSITCPDSVINKNALSTCEVTVDYIVVADDDCPAFLNLKKLGTGPLPGDIVPVGSTYSITWEARDRGNNVKTCTFTVIAMDDDNPELYIPSDTTIAANVPFVYSVTATDNCPGVTWAQTAGLPSGSVFPSGTNTVNTFVATDAFGKTVNKSFRVIVPASCCDGYNVDIYENRGSQFCPDANVTLMANASTYSCPTPSDTNQLCFESPTNPSMVNAAIKWTRWTFNDDNTITIRTTFSKEFVDNTYGENAIGWGSRGHTFSNLLGSDKLALALYDKDNSMKMQFYMDYFTASTGSPSGYKCLGVTGGEGSMVMGNVSDIISVTTSLDKNFNEYGYVLPLSSPATDANYTPNPSYPNWDYDVWYEVTIKESAFGAAGFGKPDITYIHASPSKTGNNSEDVVPVNCINSTANSNSTPATTSYAWSTGETTPSINVATPATYSVTATSSNGCQSTASFAVSSCPQSALSNFVILARTHAQINNSSIFSGGVGITNDVDDDGNIRTGKLEVKNSSIITSAGTFIKSSNVSMDNTSQVSTIINSAADVKLPVFEAMPYTGTTVVKVPKGTTVFLNDTLYKEINVGKNATAVFTKPVINIENHIKLADGATLKFAQCGKVRMKKFINAGQNVTINPDDKSIIFYCGDNVNFHQGAHVSGFFVLGDVKNKHNQDTSYNHLHISNSKPTQPAVFKGVFVAECVHSGENTNWYKGDFCGNCPVDPPYTWVCPGDIVLCDGEENFNLRNQYPPEIPGVAGITNDQPAVFPLGVTLVTWTVYHNNGTVEQCTQKVTRSAPITVAINKNGLFCENSFNLTSVVTGTPASTYLWSTGETTPNIIADPNGGEYSVTVTNALGCDTSTTVLVSIDPTNLIQPYVLFGKDNVTLRKSTVDYGALGVSKSDGFADILEESPLINYSGNFAKAPKVNVDISSTVPQVILSPANVILPVFEANPYTSTVDVVVPASGTMELTGTLYNNITVGTNASLTFTQEDINLNKLIIGQGASIHFTAPCGKVRVKTELSGGKSIDLNTEMKSFIFYVGNNVSFSEGTHAKGVFYLGQPGKLDYTFEVSDYTNTRQSEFEGMVIAKTIKSGKNTKWTLNNLCAGCTILRTMEQNPAGNAYNETSEITVNNYPNPFANSTSIYFTLPADEHVVIDVYDNTGKKVTTLFDANAMKNQEYKIDFDASGLPAGVYIYKMTTTSKTFTGRMTMIKL
ncbi:MAG TPA: HYR domain-containing protein [Bacteroidales bacterium]|nr:HYR domain-containing protein [Bacteroidales bacterium]HPI29434.1 HYR domain-containing protein [Bacteroidales bacterium]HQN16424.1 HYR domain-containing protein [Bacteroidales bacterium]